MTGVLQEAAQRLTARKLACVGIDESRDVLAVIDLDMILDRLLLGSGITRDEFERLCVTFSTRLAGEGWRDATIPSLCASAWSEGLLLGMYARQVADERERGAQ